MAVHRWHIILIIVSLCTIPYILFIWYSNDVKNIDLLSPIIAREQLDSLLSFDSSGNSKLRRDFDLKQRSNSAINNNDRPKSELTALQTSVDKEPNFASPTKFYHHKGVSYSDNKSSLSDIEPRVAVVIPYIGRVLPSWFDMFALSAKASRKMFDWLIFISEAPKRDAPDNIKFIRLSLDEFYWRFAEIDKEYANNLDSKSMLAQYFRTVLGKHPYILVEMKPAFGFLFRDYLEGYTHWAYADLDTIIGRVHLHLTPTMLLEHDIITFSFGDNFRLYLRGQLTIHKNNQHTSNIWRGCKHLSNMGDRMKQFFQPNGKWRFHSAEGCYSSVAANDSDTSMLYLPLQMSDAFRAPVSAKESIILGDTIIKCFSDPIDFKKTDAIRSLMSLDSVGPLSFNNSYNSKRNQPRLMIKLNRIPPRCSYWIRPEFDVCVDFVPSNASVVISNRDIYYYLDERYTVLDHCREASIAHFQGWKRSYYKYTTRLATRDSHAVVVSDVGLIPIRLNNMGVKTHQDILGADALISGKMSSIDLQELSQYLASRDKSEDRSATQYESYFFSESDYYHKIGRLMSGFHPNGVSTSTSNSNNDNSNRIDLKEMHHYDIHATSYCAQFSTDLKKCLCYISGDDIAVIQIGKPLRCNSIGECEGLPEEDAIAATLISVGWIEDFYITKQFDSLLDSWSGPKMLILARVNDMFKDSPKRQLHTPHRPDVTIIEVDLTTCYYDSHRDSIKMAAVELGHQLKYTNMSVLEKYLNGTNQSMGSQDSEPVDNVRNYYVLPDNTLYNIGIDSVSTAYVCIVPSNAVMKRFDHISDKVDNSSMKGSSFVSAERAVKRILQIQRLEREKLAEGTVDRTPLPIALVVPAFMRSAGATMQHESSVESEGRADSNEIKGTDLLKLAAAGYDFFPPFDTTLVDNSDCGAYQPESLLITWEDAKSPNIQLLPFNAQELLTERSLMLPVIFNVRDGPHGSGFARFPEELNGPGCFGASYLRVLAGSGYPLFWDTGYQFAEMRSTGKLSGTFALSQTESLNSKSKYARIKDNCHCSYDSDPNALRDMVTHTNSYFLKAILLRRSGLSEIYSRDRFGSTFERDQLNPNKANS